MHINRGFLFWGLALITAGSVALAFQQGYLDRTAIGEAWRLWPLVLVAIGISLIASRTAYAPVGTVVSALVIGGMVGALLSVGPGISVSCSDRDPTDLQSRSGTLGADASVELALNCGTLDVTMSPDSTWTAQVGTTKGPLPQVSSAEARLSIMSADLGGGAFVDRGRERWIVTLPVGTTYSASVRPNAANVTLDLAGGQFKRLDLHPNAGELHVSLADASVTGFNLEMNAGTTTLKVTSGTSLSGAVQMNAGELNLCTTGDVALRVTASGVAFGTNLDGSGLAHSGDTWQSANYEGAAHQITLTVKGNAASFNLNQSGGCE